MITRRTISAFILSVLYIFSSGPVFELCKLPVLISHYYDHWQQNKVLTPGIFLIQHYYYEDGTDADGEEDNKLPFKSVENAGPVPIISLTFCALEFTVHYTPQQITRVFGIYKNDFLSSLYLKNIWQPPRPCPVFTA